MSEPTPGSGAFGPTGADSAGGAGPAGGFPDPTAGDPTTALSSPPWGAPDSTALAVGPTPARRRSPGAVAAAVVGVVALLAAGAFAVVKITGSDDEGGAASPTEAGNELIAALNEEDVLGVVDLLLPSERDTLRQPLLELVEELKRLEVLSDDATLDDIGGVDLQFSDVTVREETTNAADITNIFLSGTSTAVVNGEEVPLGDLLIDSAFDGDRPDLDQPAQTDEFADLPITTVERGGRWYVSAFYTVAEQSRGDEDIPEAVAAQGAEQPEGAVNAMIEALAGLDLDEAIALLDPTEAEALQRYAPLFLDDAEQAADDAGIRIDVSNATYTVGDGDDRRSVGIDSIELTLSEDGSENTASLTYADGCLAVTGMSEETMEVCGTSFDELDEFLGDNGFADPDGTRDLLEAYSDAFDDFDASGIAVHQVGDLWYVSPLRSMFDGYDSVFDALDREEIDRIIEATTQFVEGISSGLGGTDCLGDESEEDGCMEV